MKALLLSAAACAGAAFAAFVLVDLSTSVLLSAVTVIAGLVGGLGRLLVGG